MKTFGIIKKGEYFDSVTLMLIAKRISEIKEVLDSAVVLGTDQNKAILLSSEMSFSELKTAQELDLVIAIKVENEEKIEQIVSQVEFLLSTKKEKSENSELNPSSIESAIENLKDANLSLISVAGKYAHILAKSSLENNMNVMLFSDNVSVEDEIELKQYAKEKGLLVMGPDCGTAIINGVPLAFANVVNRGNIGIVAASGTGLQEVSTIISNCGYGISQAIGTGGRDIKKDVGGIMFLEGIKLLANDENTKVILLVSKPPADEVVEKIKLFVKDVKKPVVSVFLGASLKMLTGSEIYWATTLEEGALISVALSKGEKVESIRNSILEIGNLIKKEALSLRTKLNAEQKYLRALYSGGTFCDEAQLLFQNSFDEIYSNVPFGTSKKLSDNSKSQKHTIIDLGDDEFTVGKPHPMIDYSIRCKRILQEAKDPETSVILFDIVLGWGSNMDPLKDILPAINSAKVLVEQEKRNLIFICSVTGTEKDPQNRKNVVSALLKSGVIVKESNAAAIKLAIEVLIK